MREVRKLLGRWWGFVLLLVLVVLWSGPNPSPALLAVLSLASTAFFLFDMPVWCAADTRDGTPCRHNARGLLMGCEQVRQHKWQKLKLVIVPRTWRELNRGLWVTPPKSVATMAALASVVSAVAAVIALFLQQ
jgi:hypothetical protein